MEIRFALWLMLVTKPGYGMVALNVHDVSNSCSDNSGTEFVVVFLPNSRVGVPLKLYLLTPLDSSVRVSIRTPSWISSQFLDQTVYVFPKNTTIVDLPDDLMLSGVGIEQKVVSVVADNNIVVYSGNIQRSTADMYLVYPSRYAGRQYLAPKPHNGDVTVSVVTLNDDTFVEVQSDGMINTNGTDFSSSMSTTLNAYSVLNVKSPDCNHVMVTANETVAVIAGHKFLGVDTIGGTTKDHMVEQMLPTNLWSKEYVVVSSYSDPGFGEHVKIYSIHDNTSIVITNSSQSLTATLPSLGDSYNFFMHESEPVVVKGDKEIAVFQYGIASNTNMYYSDVYLYQVSGTKEYLQTVVFPNPPSPTNQYTLEGTAVVVANKDALDSVYLNGELVNSSWSNVGQSDYHFTRINLIETFNTLSTNISGGKLSGFISSKMNILQMGASIGKYMGSSEAEDVYKSVDRVVMVKFKEMLTDLIPVDDALHSAFLSRLRCFSRCVKLPGCTYVAFNKEMTPNCRLYDFKVSCGFRKREKGSKFYSRI